LEVWILFIHYLGSSPLQTLPGTDSVVREATDHLSETQISDVNSAVTSAGTQGGNSAFTSLQSLLSQVPGHKARELSSECSSLQRSSDDRAAYIQRSRAAPTGGDRDFVQDRAFAQDRAWDLQTGDFDPEKVAQEIYPILKFRDQVVKFIENTIEKVPPPIA
jgi:hypothetical protein